MEDNGKRWGTNMEKSMLVEELQLTLWHKSCSQMTQYLHKLKFNTHNVVASMA